MAKTIILNRICVGDYLDEGSNLGHEVVNMFKPDGKDYYYAYLMADGTYPAIRKNDQVEAIYFTKAINSDCVEVVSVGTGITPVFKPQKGFKCFKGGGGKTELNYLFKELLTESELNKVYDELNIFEIKTLMNWLDTKSFLSMKPFGDERKQELKEKAESLYSLAAEIEKKTRTNRMLDLCKAIRRRAAHIEQLYYIIVNDVRYGGVRVNELFKDNTSEEYGLAIYLTYKVEKIVKPSKATYLITNKNYLIQRKAVPIHNIIIVDRKRLASTSLASFVEMSEKTNFERLIKNSKEITEKGSAIDIYKPLLVEDNFNFLTLIKKEYDELVFSNMFQYFFTHKDYKKLFIDFLKNKFGISLSDSFVIKREQANIDLLVIDDENAIVIENKIKSGINGIEVDEDGTTVKTQLEKYKKYVEKEYENKKHTYLIFMPDYSNISSTELEEYDPVAYSELVGAFESGLSIKSDKANEVYFADYLNALKRHSKEIDNRYEDTIRKRMYEMINNK